MLTLDWWWDGDGVRNGRDENLLGNTLACGRLELLLVNFAHGQSSPSLTLTRQPRLP